MLGSSGESFSDLTVFLFYIAIVLILAFSTRLKGGGPFFALFGFLGVVIALFGFIQLGSDGTIATPTGAMSPSPIDYSFLAVAVLSGIFAFQRAVHK